MLVNILLTTGVACAQLPPVNAEFRELDADASAAAFKADLACWQARIHLGRFALAIGDFDEAMKHFKAVAEQLPDNSVAYTWLGRTYLSRAGAASSLGDAKDGVKYLEKAIVLDAENLDARETLASFHREAPWIAGGDMDEADKQAEFIRQRDPERGVLILAQNRMADGDEDDAIAMLSEALTAHPEWQQVALQLGIFHHQEENFGDAFKVLSTYAAQSDVDPMIVYQLGRTAALSGRYLDEGRAAMQRYIALAEADNTLGVPPSPAWWRLGMIEQHAGDKEAARAAYEKALEFDPENREARDALRKLK